jgi:hypothetical protein
LVTLPVISGRALQNSALGFGMRAAARLAAYIYVLQAAIGATIGFALPWLQYIAN